MVVVLHEWGHYMAAKLLGVKVLRVHIGIGKPIASFRIRGTEWIFGPLMVGGVTKLLDDAHTPVEEQDRHHAYNRQALGRRVAIILGGVAANLVVPTCVIAWLLAEGIVDAAPTIREPHPLTVAHAAGLSEGDRILSVNGTPTEAWWQFEQQLRAAVESPAKLVTVEVLHRQTGTHIGVRVESVQAKRLGPVAYLPINLGFERIRGDTDPLIGRVVGGSPADLAGLRAGDYITEVAGRRVSSWSDVARTVERLPSAQVFLRFRRDGAEFVTTVIPRLKDYGLIKVGTLGIYPLHELSAPVSSYADRSMPGRVAITGALLYSIGVVQAAVENVVRLVSGEDATSLPRSPATAAQSVADAMHGGPLRVLALLCALSLAVGWGNLLPLPMLDGGHLVRVLWQASPFGRRAAAQR